MGQQYLPSHELFRSEVKGHTEFCYIHHLVLLNLLPITSFMFFFTPSSHLYALTANNTFYSPHTRARARIFPLSYLKPGKRSLNKKRKQMYKRNTACPSCLRYVASVRHRAIVAPL